MDGASVVAALIVVCFFVTMDFRLFQPKNPMRDTTIFTSPATSALPAQSAPTPQAAQPAVSPPDAQAVPDYSAFTYQFVGYDRMDALIRKYNADLSQLEVDKIKMSINLYSREKNIDPRLTLALMARESRFDPLAVSSSGAVGLGQIMPMNYEELGISNPNDIDQNVRGTIYYFRQKLDEWSGNSRQLELGLASYLRGSGDIRRTNEQLDAHAQSYVDEILRIRASV
ncbi:MAG: transglycosylase SLT domain-containing protein [Candidatus Margulisbacteria bacterium]|jgi:soluble lytic murein transglycosylase-like protein|nr:transglycosylase SLT domain-containing protein [Candidatus Margulisiibacteriota bacterium]